MEKTSIDLRDFIAIEAMKETIRSYNNDGLYIGDGNNASQIAFLSYKMADKMMLERRTVKNIPQIEELDLSIRTSNILLTYDINCVRKLISYKELDLLKLPLMGSRSISEIKKALKRFNLNLAD